MTRPTRTGFAAASATAAVAVLLTGYGTAAAQAAQATDNERTTSLDRAGYPAPTVKVLAANGTACPSTSNIIVRNLDDGYFSIRYGRLNAKVGPGVDTELSRRACSVSLKVEHSRGVTYGVKSVRVDGVGSLARGARGRADVTMSGDGSTTGVYTRSLNGPYRGAYTGTGVVKPGARGVCGEDRAFLVTSAVAVNKGTSSDSAVSALNLQPNKVPAGLTVRLVNLLC